MRLLESNQLRSPRIFSGNVMIFIAYNRANKRNTSTPRHTSARRLTSSCRLGPLLPPWAQRSLVLSWCFEPLFWSVRRRGTRAQLTCPQAGGVQEADCSCSIPRASSCLHKPYSCLSGGSSTSVVRTSVGEDHSCGQDAKVHSLLSLSVRSLSPDSRFGGWSRKEPNGQLCGRCVLRKLENGRGRGGKKSERRKNENY